MYPPPQPKYAAEQPQYMATVKLIGSWYENILQSLPCRCIPLVYADLNDGQGISRISGKWASIESTAVGEGRCREQRRGGA
eukprot:9392672-Pyramimonas_sp.AAC.1